MYKALLVVSAARKAEQPQLLELNRKPGRVSLCRLLETANTFPGELSREKVHFHPEPYFYYIKYNGLRFAYRTQNVNFLFLLDNSNTARHGLSAPIISATLPIDESSKEKFRWWILSSAV
jgi:hypothetical protein